MKRCLKNIYDYLYFTCYRIFSTIFVFGWQLSEIIVAFEYKNKVNCEIISVNIWFIVKSILGVLIIKYSLLNIFSTKKSFINDLSKYLINMICIFYIAWILVYIFILNIYCKNIEPRIYIIFSMIYGFVFSFIIIKKFNIKRKDNIPLLDIDS